MGRRRPTFSVPRRRSWPWALVLLLIGLGYHYFDSPFGRPLPAPESGEVLVERVVDGDTLKLSDGRYVRLIGVDTPETKHPDKPVQAFGPEASAFTRTHVEGRAVRLELDRERLDRHGRTLGYVYVGDWFLNEQLLRAGLGRAVTRFPYSDLMKRRFRQAELDAREQRRGLWQQESSIRAADDRGTSRRRVGRAISKTHRERDRLAFELP